jgi:pimeloyl-ACP methyl ester carboxylesterase
MPAISANGARFHVQRMETTAAADAPTVVFIHGLVTDNLSSFYYTLAGPVVAAGARAVLYDLRGHGRSDRPPNGYTTSDGVADLCALLDALGVTVPAYLVGNSYGGLIATRLAITAPERVAGLALIETACAGPGEAAWMEDILNTLTVAALSLEHDQTADRLKAAGRRKLAKLAAASGSLLNETSLIEDLGTERPLDLAALELIGCPVLGVYGERSELRPAADDLRGHVRDCRVEIIGGLAHTVLREATALLSEILLDWLPARWPHE